MMVLQAAIIGYSIIDNAKNINSDLFARKPINLSNIVYWFSMSGFFFISHPTLSSLIKQHKNKNKDWLAVILAYAIITVIYISVGLLGALALYR